MRIEEITETKVDLDSRNIGFALLLPRPYHTCPVVLLQAHCLPLLRHYTFTIIADSIIYRGVNERNGLLALYGC
jgi:hypothetical protein